jgi:diguanylate cyclase (GGDEF)-like protein/PAS domain S-box-containing protein
VADTSLSVVATAVRPVRAPDRWRTYHGAVVVLVLAIAAFAVWPVLVGADSHSATVTTDIAECVVAALAAVAAAWRGHVGERGWYLIALACLAWLGGQVVWTWYELVQGQLAPLRTAADIGFLLAMPFMFAGFLALGFGANLRPRVRWLHRLTEAFVIASSLAFVFWELSLAHVFEDDVVTGLDRALLVAYPVGDIAIVTMALVAVLNRRNRSLEIAAVGAVALAIGDGVYTLYQSQQTFRTGTLGDLLWIIGMALITIAALRPDSIDATSSRQELAARSLLGYGPTLAALGVGIYQLVDGRPSTDGVRMVLIACIGGAILANQLTAYAENAVLQRSVYSRLDDLAQSEQRFRLVVDDLAEGLLILDGEGRIKFANHRIGQLLGVAPSELIGHYGLEMVHPDDEARVLDAFARVLRRDRSQGALTARLKRADGSTLWVECDASNLLAESAVDGVVASIREVTERLEADAALTNAQERFRAAFEYAPIGMALARIDGTLVEVNGAFARMVGYGTEQLLGRNDQELTHPDDWSLNELAAAQLRRDPAGNYQLEKRYVRSDGRTVWASLSFSYVAQADGSQLVITQVEDITQRKAIAERLEYSARHDELTGLANRAQFMDRLTRALGRIGGDGERVALMLLDLDRFKVVNDSLGHAAGDELLRVIARRLQRAVRPADTVARFGGDEFTVLMVDPPTDAEVLAQADRIRRSIADAVPLSDGDTYVSASIGVVVGSRPELTAESLVQDADAAMYRAKERGRNRVERFDTAARASVVRRLRTGNDLHRALQRSEFRVEYQPVVAIETGRLIGFEALARWEHPDRGLVTPAEFIDLAEETGLIVPIGSAVMREAFDRVACWRREPASPAAAAIQVSVNLSARQLGTPGLVGSVAEAIEETGISPECVWLEITESALMTDTKAASVTLRALRGIGVHLTVDDFGTGYSSLTYLQRFPVEGLKIDRSFIDGLGTEANDTTIVDTLVRLGHSLGLTVVAEGVETLLQLEHLRHLGCDNGQGYLFGRPMQADVLDRELASWLEMPLPAPT